MKVIRLTSEHIGSLLSQPESGMGFQVAEVARPYAREEEPWLVFNAEIAISFASTLETRTWEGMRNAGSLEWLEAQAEQADRYYREPRVVVTRSGVGLAIRAYGTASALSPAPLSLIKKTVTKAGSRYCRFSAFENDRRVDAKTGSFLPGTYATTGTDEPMAPSGFAAVGRYALPNVHPSSFLHYLSSLSGEAIHIGTVAPAYGQSGGGVEVFFPAGARNSAGKRESRQIPDE